MRSSMVLVLGVALLSACDGATTPTPVNSPPPVAPTAAPTPVPSPTPAATSVTGYWRSEARSWDLRLEQNASTITGHLVGFKDNAYSNPQHADLQITGAVSETGDVEFSAAAFALSFSGKTEAGGARMTGTLYDCVNVCRNYGEILNKR
jgi:hypothetical protein